MLVSPLARDLLRGFEASVLNDQRLSDSVSSKERWHELDPLVWSKSFGADIHPLRALEAHLAFGSSVTRTSLLSRPDQPS